MGNQVEEQISEILSTFIVLRNWVVKLGVYLAYGNSRFFYVSCTQQLFEQSEFRPFSVHPQKINKISTNVVFDKIDKANFIQISVQILVVF